MNKKKYIIPVVVLALLFIIVLVWYIFRDDREQATFLKPATSSEPVWAEDVRQFREQHQDVFTYSYIIPIAALREHWGAVDIRFRIMHGMHPDLSKTIILCKYNSNGSIDRDRLLLMNESPLCPRNCDYLTNTAAGQEFTPPDNPVPIPFSEAQQMTSFFANNLPADNCTQVVLPKETMRYFTSIGEVEYLKIYHYEDNGERKVAVVGLNGNGVIDANIQSAIIRRPNCPRNCLVW